MYSAYPSGYAPYTERLMNSMKQLLILLALILPLVCHSQEDIDSIDIKCDQCMSLDSNYSTNSMISCIWAAQEEWTEQMNIYYNLLTEKLSKESVKLLYNAQEVWLNYKEAQISYLNSFYHSDIHGGNHLERAEESKNLVRKRALELKVQYKALIEQ